MGFIDFASFQPLFVNRCIQTIVQHRHFHKLCGGGNSDLTAIRSEIVQLLVSLFNLHPSNTCQPSHINPLVTIYSGTMSHPDRSVLSIFQLFEWTRNGSVSAMLSQWSPANSASTSSLDALNELDPIMMLRTCRHFPDSRAYDRDVSTSQRYADTSQVYDPIFILALFSHMMSTEPPASALSWVQLMRTNVISFLIRCLASKDDIVRSMAFTQISALWEHLGVCVY